MGMATFICGSFPWVDCLSSLISKSQEVPAPFATFGDSIMAVDHIGRIVYLVISRVVPKVFYDLYIPSARLGVALKIVPRSFGAGSRGDLQPVSHLDLQ